MQEAFEKYDNPTSQTHGRGLVLCSGGLDSSLAVAILRAQGLHVEGVVFSSPFFSPDRALRAGESLKIKMHVLDFEKKIIALVQFPPHGHGAHLNPCVDCHLTMIKLAGELMENSGYDFVATGEVLGQRPMSQNRKALDIVARGSGYGDRVIRPLSAQLLEPTLPETKGVVDRSKLLAISGRSRKQQVALAKHYNIINYPAPAGGCLLTDEGFCRRLSDLMKYEGLDDSRLLKLLRIGRHFRLPGGSKCIVGRNYEDNKRIQAITISSDIMLSPAVIPGPNVLIPNSVKSVEDLNMAVQLCAAYSDCSAENSHTIDINISRVNEATICSSINQVDRKEFAIFML